MDNFAIDCPKQRKIQLRMRFCSLLTKSSTCISSVDGSDSVSGGF